jgi:hypothetical protein
VGWRRLVLVGRRRLVMLRRRWGLMVVGTRGTWCLLPQALRPHQLRMAVEEIGRWIVSHAVVD